MVGGKTPIAFVLFLFFHLGMQYALPFAAGNPLLRIHGLLLDRFGPVPACHRLDPVGMLVFAMLSGRTRDEIAMRTFVDLEERLESWEQLAGMSPAAVEPLIANVTFAARKARHLPAALQEIIRRRGRLDLGFLAAWPVEEARHWLERLTGVGPKTSMAVLNLSSLHLRVLMVDTAHNRVARRLGIVPEKADIARATRLLNRCLPLCWTADDTEDHHVLMQRLGRALCVHARPCCAECPLLATCRTAAASAAGPGRLS
jgi:endonuclease-3